MKNESSERDYYIYMTQHEITERVAAGLRNMSKEPIFLLLHQNILTPTFSKKELCGLPILVSSGFMISCNPISCPFIPIFRDVDEMLGVEVKNFCEGFDDYNYNLDEED